MFPYGRSDILRLEISVVFVVPPPSLGRELQQVLFLSQSYNLLPIILYVTHQWNIMKTIIHVNQHVIKSNKKTERLDPVITVKTYKNNTRCNSVAIYDQLGQEVARVIYSPDKPLACGARVWIETYNDIECLGHTETTTYKKGSK